MVIVMQERASDEQIQNVIAQLVGMGFDVHRSTGALRTVIGAVGPQPGDPRLIEMLDGVQGGAADHRAVQAREPLVQAGKHRHHGWRRADRRRRGDRDGGSLLGRERGAGGGHDRRVRRAGAKVLRGGAFKPRSSPTASRDSAKKGCGCCAMRRPGTG
jgi:3-deoxy-7-phosphoheptulonate synthase